MLKIFYAKFGLDLLTIMQFDMPYLSFLVLPFSFIGGIAL